MMNVGHPYLGLCLSTSEVGGPLVSLVSASLLCWAIRVLMVTALLDLMVSCGPVWGLFGGCWWWGGGMGPPELVMM